MIERFSPLFFLKPAKNFLITETKFEQFLVAFEKWQWIGLKLNVLSLLPITKRIIYDHKCETIIGETN